MGAVLGIVSAAQVNTAHYCVHTNWHLLEYLFFSLCVLPSPSWLPVVRAQHAHCVARHVRRAVIQHRPDWCTPLCCCLVQLVLALHSLRDSKNGWTVFRSVRIRRRPVRTSCPVNTRPIVRLPLATWPSIAYALRWCASSHWWQW